MPLEESVWLCLEDDDAPREHLAVYLGDSLTAYDAQIELEYLEGMGSIEMDAYVPVLVDDEGYECVDLNDKQAAPYAYGVRM